MLPKSKFFLEFFEYMKNRKIGLNDRILDFEEADTCKNTFQGSLNR